MSFSFIGEFKLCLEKDPGETIDYVLHSTLDEKMGYIEKGSKITKFDMHEFFLYGIKRE